jgi:hypothetical protein
MILNQNYWITKYVILGKNFRDILISTNRYFPSKGKAKE